MSNETKEINEFQSAIFAVLWAGNILANHDLLQILADIQFAEKLMAEDVAQKVFGKEFADFKSKNMAEDKELVKAALPLWQLIHTRREAAEEIEARRAGGEAVQS